MKGGKEARKWVDECVGQVARHEGVVGLKVMREVVVDLSTSSSSPTQGLSKRQIQLNDPIHPGADSHSCHCQQKCIR